MVHQHNKKQQLTTTFGRAVKQCSGFVTRLNMCAMLQMKPELKKDVLPHFPQSMCN